MKKCLAYLRVLEECYYHCTRNYTQIGRAYHGVWINWLSLDCYIVGRRCTLRISVVGWWPGPRVSVIKACLQTFYFVSVYSQYSPEAYSRGQKGHHSSEGAADETEAQ